MVTQHILTSLCAVLLSRLILPHLLLVLAAAAGELAKDEKHLAAVEKVGADFIPLAVETFGA